MDRRVFLKTSPLAAAALITNLLCRQHEADHRPSRNPPACATIGTMCRSTWLKKCPSRARGGKRTWPGSPLQQPPRIELPMIQTKVWECIGGKPENTPLNAVVTGIIEREKYRIEKLVFESQPGFFVTAHLYLPKSGAKPCPAILAPLGHYPEGKVARSYQTVFQNLARKGYAVLAFDPPGQGERLQYLDHSGSKSLYMPTGEHDRFGWPALLVGSSAAQIEAWDGIRAVDYLVSRPEIDTTRIGCCGHSGGGTQAMFLCALEPRIKAAVVVEGHTENLAGEDYEAPGAYADAEQNLIGSLKLPSRSR